MNFHVVTLFPEAVEAAARSIGVVGQALARGELGLTTLTPRTFTTNVHHTIDDRPFGGGDGMIMMAEPLSQCVRKIKGEIDSRDESLKKVRVIHVSPRGSRLDDKKVRELAQYTDLILVSSRYGGADQRFLNVDVDEEISIGDYILTGGELAVLVLVDAVGRMQPGVLGNVASASNETFAGTNGLLEHPQFTRPREWEGQAVPAAYLSGDHKKIAEYQEAVSIVLTAVRRPDLLTDVSSVSRQRALALLATMSESELRLLGLELANRSDGSSGLEALRRRLEALLT